MSAEKTITRALAVIDKRIDRLLLKREEVKERWPYDLYGGKADSKLDEIDEEVKALKRWKTERTEAAGLRQRLAGARQQINAAEATMNAALSALAIYDSQKADALRRGYWSAEKKRQAGLW